MKDEIPLLWTRTLPDESPTTNVEFGYNASALCAAITA